MSAYGPKQTSASALHMSAFGGKADTTLCGTLSRSLLGVKRTCPFAPHMSAHDPKRTFAGSLLPHLRGCSSARTMAPSGGDSRDNTNGIFQQAGNQPSRTL